jgi:3alpha(or 20beta)-hydroxysteroid dehydrogenase
MMVVNLVACVEAAVGRLDGKVAIISGAARGQGEAEARLFVREGADVVLGDVLDDEGNAVASSIGDGHAAYVHLDVTDPDQWDAAVSMAMERFGRLNVLVNNAGILLSRPLEGHPLDEYLAVIQVNQVGCFLGMRAVVEPMRTAGGGSIVNTSSLAGLSGATGLLAYTASKFAIRGMTKVAALELGPSGIRVNSIHPGGIDTAMIQGSDLDAGFRHLPLGRVGRPDEAAAMALFLASDEASYSTGSEFVLDGGSTAGLTRRR